MEKITIIVNTRNKDWFENKITFEEVIILAFDSYNPDPRISYTVLYSKDSEHKMKDLVKGQEVPVKEGMIFNVSKTDKS